MTHTPFRIGHSVGGPFFTGRAYEVRRILLALRHPTRLLLTGPRRVGKSSVMAAAADRARSEGILVIDADVETASGPVDVANRLLHSFSRQRPRDRLASFVAGLGSHATLGDDPATGAPRVAYEADRRRASAERQRGVLDDVVERVLAEARSRGQQLSIILDEVQAVRRFGGEPALRHVRGLIERHASVSFVCAASELHVIHPMLARGGAFARLFELLPLGPLERDHLARWIDEGLERAGAGVTGPGAVGAGAVGPGAVGAGAGGAAIIDAVGPRTQDVLQVARHVHSGRRARRRGEGTSLSETQEEAIEEAIEEVVDEQDAVIRATFIDLTTQQQNVLRAVAAGVDQLFASTTRDRFGLPTSSSVAAAVDALEERGLLFREEGRVRFDSPFVRRWVEREALRDIPPAE